MYRTSYSLLNRLDEMELGFVQGIRSAITSLAWTAGLIAPLVLRFALAVPFFKSGLTKWHGFLSLAPSAVYLFQNEFKLHLGFAVYHFPAPGIVAFGDGVAEIVLPLLLVAGLATRFSAFGLLLMTIIIELVVPAGWANFHLPWAGLALAIITLGAGPLSFDYLIGRAFRAPKSPGSGRAVSRKPPVSAEPPHDSPA